MYLLKWKIALGRSRRGEKEEEEKAEKEEEEETVPLVYLILIVIIVINKGNICHRATRPHLREMP